MNRRTLYIAIAILIAGCATSPLGRRQIMLVGDAEMDKMGVEAFEQLKSEGKVSSESQTNGYVTCVAHAITSAIDSKQYPNAVGSWEVRVFQDDTANAFALPGRKIGVHTGLLKVATNQDQLATVIGHEVGHVLAKHGAERVSDQFATQIAAQGAGALLGAVSSPATQGVAMAALGVGAQTVVLKFSRTQESEADALGLDLMASAGFDPRESVSLWKNMAAASQGNQPPEFISTHPAHATRINDLEARIPQDVPVAEQARKQGRNPHCR
jgi:predicted Zn-dependent protease